MKRIHIICTFLALILVGCTSQPTQEITPSPENIPTTTATAITTLIAEATTTPEGPITLTIWVPPEFEPASGAPGGDILQARLDEFTTRRSNTNIEVRVKSLEGPGGLLDSLTTASAVAPLALPDLIALPRPLLEIAAIKGLLHSYDELSDAMESPDWYEYAKQMARLQNSTFGLPFAGDPLTMVYRTTTISEPPRNYTSTLTTTGPFAFAAADPRALYPLALYQASGGSILDDQGRPNLDAKILTSVYDFYNAGATSELMPVWITQYQTDDSVWQAFEENRAEMIITWSSRHLQEALADSAAVPLATQSGEPYTYATGWVWSLTSSDPLHQSLSVELAEFLTESAFLGQWMSAAGYIPPRPNALTVWQTTPLRSYAHQVSLSSQIIPPADILASLAPPVTENTILILKLQSDPATAAQLAADSVNAP